MTVSLLMAHRSQDGHTEAEPVLVTVDEGLVRLVLDDGVGLCFDRGELAEVLVAGEREAA